MEKDQIVKEILWWVKSLVIIFAIVIIITQKFVVLAKVPTGSMLNTIKEQDLVMADRLAYKDEDPKRGDIVIFYAPDEQDELYIKRVIGLPGDKVVIDNAQIYINDSPKPLDEPYLKEKWVINAGYYEFDVPDNCYLMLGDNRNSSLDSREWENTYVNRNAIVAKAKCVYFPFNHIKSLNQNENNY